MTDKKEKRGPKADHLKINIPWEEAMNKALKKERPKDGWPDEKKKAKSES